MSRNMLLLDCSTANAAWAFVEDGKLLAGAVEFAPPSASVTVADHLQQVFADDHELLANLGAVYVAEGPGSFTGLRVALALGKGVAYASQVPLLGFSSLESIAFAAIASSHANCRWVAATIDAKKHEIYAALYEVTASGLREDIAAGAYAFDDFSQKLAGKNQAGGLIVAGTGTHLVETEATVIYDHAASIEGLVLLGHKLEMPNMSAGEMYNSWNLRPFYARLSEAEIGLLKRNNQ